MQSRNCGNCGTTFYKRPNTSQEDWNENHKGCGLSCSLKLRWKNPAEREKLVKSHIGHRQSLETRRKRSRIMTGSLHPQWRGGKTKEHNRLRGTLKYKEWRRKVFERDGYACTRCGAKGVYVQADHIKPFAYFPKFRFWVKNGRTLCVPCHELTDTYKVKARLLYEQKTT